MCHSLGVCPGVAAGVEAWDTGPETQPDLGLELAELLLDAWNGNYENMLIHTNSGK